MIIYLFSLFSVLFAFEHLLYVMLLSMNSKCFFFFFLSIWKWTLICLFILLLYSLYTLFTLLLCFNQLNTFCFGFSFEMNTKKSRKMMDFVHTVLLIRIILRFSPFVVVVRIPHLILALNWSSSIRTFIQLNFYFFVLVFTFVLFLFNWIK